MHTFYVLVGSFVGERSHKGVWYFFFFESKLSAGLASHNLAAALARSPDIEDSLWPVSLQRLSFCAGVLSAFGVLQEQEIRIRQNLSLSAISLVRASIPPPWHNGWACDQAAEGRVHR